MDYILSFDIGTSGAKTLLMSFEGEIVNSTLIEYDIESPQLNWAQEDPGIWWESIIKGTNLLKKENPDAFMKIKVVGVSGQMHGPVFVDDKGRPLYPCIIWADNRTSKECDFIINKLGEETVQNITGNPVIPAYTLPKIIWIKHNFDHIYNKTYKILLPKDYIRFKLTNKFYTDYSDASGTLLFDIHRKAWSENILNGLDLEIDKMPRAINSQEIAGQITKRSANILGLKAGIPVVAGAGDLACGAVGNNNLSEGNAAITIGTAGQVVATTDRVYPDTIGKLFNFCHAAEEKYFVLASVLSAGLSLKWFKDNISLIENITVKDTSLDAYDLLLKGVEKVPPGADELFFLPYLNGAGTPYMDDKAKGVFIGITPKHNKKYLVRAILEGVTFGIKECLETIKSLKIDINEIVISAGGAKNELWKQIQADIYNQKLITLRSTDTSPLGAAILAAVGYGKFSTLQEACNFYVRRKGVQIPDEKNALKYQQLYQKYKQIYPGLRDYFSK